MDNLYWILWFVLGAALIVAEVFTSGFVLLWFGVGALAAAFAGIIGINNLGRSSGNTTTLPAMASS